MTTNRKVVLTAPVRGIPQAEDFLVVEASLPVPQAGEILVRHIYLSLDPYQRAVMSGAHPTAKRALQENEAPSAETIGQIINSCYRERLAEWQARGWQIDVDAVEQERKHQAFAIPCPTRRDQPTGWVLDAVPLMPEGQVADSIALRSGTRG